MREIKITDLLRRLNNKNDATYYLELFSDFSGNIKGINGGLYLNFSSKNEFREEILKLDRELAEVEQINIKL